MLQVEDRPTRLLLVDLLSRIECHESTRALARRAIFDVSEHVREAAVNALRLRPAEDFRDVLLEGLRYPWPAAANFAAEALVNLGDTGAVPHLVRLLDEPDPAGPCVVTNGSSVGFQVREIVRVNHVRNCMLCHPPSLAGTDPVRAAVPDPNRPLTGTYGPTMKP